MISAAATDDLLSLRSVTPSALASYARSKGWSKVGTYRSFSDVYGAEDKPEIIIPRTDSLVDYEAAVSDLIAVFGSVAGRDDRSIYRDLTVADKDVLRIRVLDASPDSLPFETSHALINRTRQMLLSAARSLSDRRRAFSARPTRQVTDYLNSIHLGHTERGSFSILIVSPSIPPKLVPAGLEVYDGIAPIERRVGERLSESLSAARRAAEGVVGGNSGAFEDTIAHGVSANLCDSVAELAESVSSFDVSFSWALTRPSDARRGPVPFSRGDAQILREAALNFRSLEPEYDKELSGFVYQLTQEQEQVEGTVSIRANVDGVRRSVVAVLNQHDYRRAVDAHASKSVVYFQGDLEKGGRQFRLLDPKIIDVIQPLQAPTLFDMSDEAFFG